MRKSIRGADLALCRALNLDFILGVAMGESQWGLSFYVGAMGR